ncbi:MAG TPA: aldehyde dehydrogenase EutE [Ignavibacteriaceae bacterium]|nr:aldehyde dehydrogenase EutE [Ignavibacteriaceae bacterium]
MELSANDITQIVEGVLRRLKDAPGYNKNGHLPLGIFETLDEAYQETSIAYKKIRNLELRNRIIQAIRQASVDHARELAEIAVKETGMGRIDDKTNKNLLVARHTPGPEVLKPTALSGDHGLTLIENAPWGVIASVTPSTNPAATIINNSISMISAGNSVIFSPHPAAKAVSQQTISILNEAVIKVGGPANLITTIAEPSIEAANNLFRYPGINLLVITGGEAVINAAKKVTDKRLMAAGAGNPPVVIDETADLARAAKSVVFGASFDNNIVCVDEKEILIVDSVADEFKREMKKYNAYELTISQADELAKVVFKNYPSNEIVLNRKFVGKDAKVLAEAIGLNVPDETKLLFVETDKNHPFPQTEMMMPVISIVRARNADEAIDWGIELEHGLKHTAAMHSRNIDNLHRMAVEINTSLFIKNGPCLAGLGYGGEGWTSMTISTPTGEGVTSAKSFARLRRCTLVDHFRIV